MGDCVLAISKGLLHRPVHTRLVKAHRTLNQPKIVSNQVTPLRQIHCNPAFAMLLPERLPPRTSAARSCDQRDGSWAVVQAPGCG
jgi:hypothetical protein